MKHRILKFTALFLAFALVLGCTGCFGGSGGNDAPIISEAPVISAQPIGIYDFSADTQYIAADAETPVSLYAYVPDAAGTVELWDGSNYVSMLSDDGMDADVAAGDGIYSLLLNIRTGPENAGSSLNFYAKSGELISETVTIDILGLPTREQAEEAGDILENLGDIVSSQAADPSMQFNEALAYADELYSQGIIREYYTQDDTIGMVHSTGMHMNFTPYIPNTLAVGDGSSVRIATMDSYNDSPEFLDPICSFSDGHRVIYSYENTQLAATAVANAFPNYYYDASADLDVGEVNLAAIADCLGPNMLVLWQGHGGFDKELGPILGTGELYDEYRYYTDPFYYAKFLSDQYVSLMDGRVGITNKFIRASVGDLSGSVILINACHSGYDSRLADAFLAKGARIVSGYTHSVYIPYASAMQYIITTKMTEINPNTGDYYTMQEALEFAQYNYGATDLDGHQKQPGKTAASVITFGESPSNIRFASVKGAAQPPVQPSVPTPEPTPVPTPEPTPVPQQNSNSDAHAAYKQMLIDYAWIGYVPSDLSEIPPTDYEEFYLGSYYVVDIDDNGIDELIIKCGQSIADMSMTVFTYKDGMIFCTGYVKSGDAWLMEITNGTGAVVVEHQGSYGMDTYIDLYGENLSILHTEEYNYEQPGYVDSKERIGYYPNTYNVHDLSGLR